MGELKQSNTFYSLAEYLEKENEEEIRHDYYKGEVYIVAGTTDRHNLIASNTLIALRQATSGRGCRVYMENVKLELVPNNFIVYPDLMLVCEPSDALDSHIKRKPSLVVEVLSKSTESYDRGKKFIHYLKLGSLEYYILVSQYAVRVEVYEKLEKGWHFEVYEQLSDTIPLSKLDISLTVSDIYEDISFES